MKKTKAPTYETTDVPAELLDLAEEKREAMVEAAAEANDVLMEKYLEGRWINPWWN